MEAISRKLGPAFMKTTPRFQTVMNHAQQSTKRNNRAAWILFWVALLLLIAGQIIWTTITGPSP